MNLFKLLLMNRNFSQFSKLRIYQIFILYSYKTLYDNKSIKHIIINSGFNKFQRNISCCKRLSSAFLALNVLKMYESIGFKKEENPEVKTLLHKAKQILEEGNINEASEVYNIALKIATNNNDIEDIYAIKEKLAVIAFFLQNYKEAETLFLEVEDYLMKSGYNVNSLRVSYIALRLAEIYENMKDYKKAENYYKISAERLPLKTKEALHKKDNETIELWLMLLISNAHYYLNRGMYDVSLKYFKKAFKISTQFRGELDERTVMLLQQLGTVYFQKGDLESAVEHLKEAVDRGKHLPGLVELSNVYITLGNIFLRQGLIKDAKILCTQGYKNAVRHKYEHGIKEANACLEELKKAV